MEYSAIDIKRLLDEISQESDKTLAHSQFHDMYLFLDQKYRERFKKTIPIADDYLYRKLFSPLIKGVNEKMKLNLTPNCLDAITQALGYKGYGEFLRMEHPSISPTTANCAGQWYSYVRCNSGQPYILRAPVKIYQDKKVMRMELQGPSRLFKGVFQASDNCHYCLLESKQAKNIYLVLKTGLVSRIEVMQGVFSGLSGGGDPIAGREILVRQVEEFSNLLPQRIAIKEMLKSKMREEVAVATYFNSAEKSIIKAGISSTFTLDDLDATA